MDFAAKLGFTGDDALAKLRGIPDTELMAKVRTGPALGINVDGWVLHRAGHQSLCPRPRAKGGVADRQ